MGTHYKALMDTLQPDEVAVLGLIANNLDQGHSIAIIEKLLALGLIRGHHAAVGQKCWWYMPAWVHIEWRQWVAER